MEYEITSHRHAVAVLNSKPEYEKIWLEVQQALDSISDEDIIQLHEERYSNQKSISTALNTLIKERMEGLGWNTESPIFSSDELNFNATGRKSGVWRLDFAKESISVEVSFNHGEAIAWNLIKPVIASEVNHVKKAINTKIGVIICATQDMKANCGFDGAVGQYEKILQYMKPLSNMLTIPIVIIGLKAPKTFDVKVEEINGKKKGFIRRF
jgi:hypothetical protein